jgi:hypothetical protein
LPWKLAGNENVTVGQDPERPNKLQLLLRIARYPNLGALRRARDWQSQASRRENSAHFFEGEVKTREASNGRQS